MEEEGGVRAATAGISSVLGGEEKKEEINTIEGETTVEHTQPATTRQESSEVPKSMNPVTVRHAEYLQGSWSAVHLLRIYYPLASLALTHVL